MVVMTELELDMKRPSLFYMKVSMADLIASIYTYLVDVLWFYLQLLMLINTGIAKRITDFLQIINK